MTDDVQRIRERIHDLIEWQDATFTYDGDTFADPECKGASEALHDLLAWIEKEFPR